MTRPLPYASCFSVEPERIDDAMYWLWSRGLDATATGDSSVVVCGSTDRISRGDFRTMMVRFAEEFVR